MSAQSDSNVVHLLRSAAGRHPNRLALVAPDNSITFGDLWQRVDRFGAGLLAAGLQSGDRAICMAPMSIELYVALLGILKVGAVAVFVDPWIGIRQVAAFSAFAEPRAFVGIPKSHALRLLEPTLRHIILGVTTGSRIWRFPARRTFAELESGGGDGRIFTARPDDPALITFTSGSSGTPKGANRTHGFLLAQHEALAAEFPARDDDVDLPTFPVFALNNIALGITTIIPDMDFRNVAATDGARIAKQIARNGVTTCTASPPFFDRLANHSLRLRRILTGGAPVTDGQIRRWRAAWPETEIVVVYGSTEAEPVAHITAEERLSVVGPGFCAGRVSPRVRARIIPIQRGPARDVRALEVGRIGELLVSGDHVCRDYFRNPEAVAENKVRELGGAVWHRMGDTGSFDARGRFWLAGRVHSTITRAGAHVHPQLVEQAAAGPDILMVAAVGLSDALMGERVVLVVVPADDELDCAVIRKRVEAAGQVVDDIVLWRDPLPVDPRHNTKIDYTQLRKRLMEKR